MDDKFYIGRLLENENLTGNLEDADANRLLDWAIERIGGLIGDPVLADEKFTALMAVLRKINRIAPDAATRPPQELAADLADLAAAYQQTFGAAPPVDPDDLQHLARSFSGQSVSQSIESLLQWLTRQ